MVLPRLLYFLVIFIFSRLTVQAQTLEDILGENIFVPDFSYAGYFNGNDIPESFEGFTVLNASDFGVIPNDFIDDSKALQKALAQARKIKNPVVLQLPAGKIILSEIFYIDRSQIIINGKGSSIEGTELYFPRPLMYNEDPPILKELREYLLKFKKVQKEKENNINLNFSQYAWSGGFLWVKKNRERVKYYLKEYDTPIEVLSKTIQGKRGDLNLIVEDSSLLTLGEVVELQWFNKEGKKGKILKELYAEDIKEIGSHHYNFPDLPLVRQQVRITEIKNNSIKLSSPLVLDIFPEYESQIVRWNHLEQVGLQNFSVTFPDAPYIAHHVEPGFNAIYLTSLYDGWVKNVKIRNADSGILTEKIANVTIEDIKTYGTNKAHYTVAMGAVHNVLVKNLIVENLAIHPLSFNTFSTKSVYTDCKVLQQPILDQHSGVNHQNLFDNIETYISLKDGQTAYPLFAGGGANYWKPSHAAYSTFWNIQVNFDYSSDQKPNKITLNGMKDGSKARVLGLTANLPIEISYEKETFVKKDISAIRKIPSLYQFQRDKRNSNF